jgi:hypothetical protein
VKVKRPGEYEVMMPGHPREEPVELIQGWELKTQRFADRKDRSFAFCIGLGKPEVAKTTDDQFFAAARDGALSAANGTLISEKDLTLEKNPGREFVVKLGDQATNRTLRVYRVGTKAVVAMAEGAFLPPDAQDVQRFFRSLSFRGTP